jgi:AraC-like DNA-binding protein
MDHAATGVVFELHEASRSDLLIVVAAMSQRSIPIPLLLRFELRGAVVPLMVDVQERVLDLRVSLRDADSLSECVARLGIPMEERASRLAIISRLQTLIPPTVLDIVTAAAVIGERHVSVRKLAALCKSSIRRVEERLTDAHLLRAKRLLMWMLSLHAVWRVTRLGWTLKHVAAEAGFKSTDDLSRLVERTVGLRLAEEARRSSFADLLTRFEHQLIR